MKTTLIKAARAATLIRVYGEDNPTVHLRLDVNPLVLRGPETGISYHFDHQAAVELSEHGIADVLTQTGYSVNLQFIVERGVKKKDIERIEAIDSGQLYADW